MHTYRTYSIHTYIHTYIALPTYLPIKHTVRIYILLPTYLHTYSIYICTYSITHTHTYIHTYVYKAHTVYIHSITYLRVPQEIHKCIHTHLALMVYRVPMKLELIHCLANLHRVQMEYDRACPCIVHDALVHSMAPQLHCL